MRITTPRERAVALAAEPRGYHEAVVQEIEPGARYRYLLDDRVERPDPASRAQPDGVHAPSAVLDHAAFSWADRGWRSPPLEDLVLYELHVGTFTPEGTFDAIVPRLDALGALGVTAIELMPVAEFPGARNWGYDGVYPFAPQSSYGGPAGLKRLVDAAHARGLAVLLDVVYNHLGPEGNYLADFGPYFTDRYRTPWGSAVNLDDAWSDEVRAFFVANAVSWVRDYHVDGLRLDAVHATFDRSASPFLADLAAAVREAARERGVAAYVIAESNLNDPRLIQPAERGGLGLDAQWSDDFHHALHVALTGERNGYYEDFVGLEDLARAYREAFVYAGRYSAFRRRRHGAEPRGCPGRQFVVFAQNHDQVGNRMMGERLASLVDLGGLKVAAAATLLSPYLPLLFMGEEYGETAPFLYFTSHSDPGLVEAVRRGRREEFAAFRWKGTPPDPQSEETFRRSVLDHAQAAREPHAALRRFYAELLRLRRAHPALRELDRERAEARADDRVLVLRRRSGRREICVLLSVADVTTTAALPSGQWRRLLDGADPRFGGDGACAPERVTSDGGTALPLAPKACVVFEREAR